jgi:hypothetical protein
MGFALQSFPFLSGDRASVSENPLRSRASLHNLRGLASAPQRLAPTGKAVPLYLLPGGLIQVGAACSHGPFDFPGFLSSPVA